MPRKKRVHLQQFSIIHLPKQNYVMSNLFLCSSTYYVTEQMCVRNQMPVSLRVGGGELGNLKP
jgi:hypothetical protein